MLQLVAWLAVGLPVSEAPSPPLIAGFPEAVAEAEQVLIGVEAPRGAARRRGAWQWSADGVSMAGPAAYGDNFWFPSLSEATITDGAIRARVRFGERPDVSIMFRCRLPDGDIERLSGYGLSIERGALRFYRWENGFPRVVGSHAETPGIRQRAGVELLIMLAGPVVTALVYDLGTAEAIATLTMTDTHFASGVIGVRAFRRQDAATTVTRLTVVRGDAESVTMGLKQEHPFSGGRIVHVARALEARIPEDLLERVVDRTDDAVVLFVGPAQTERLLRIGLEPRQITDRVPWRYLDPEYVEARKRGVVATSAGFEVNGSYKDADMVEALLMAYHRRFPKLTKLVALGESAEGRTVWALKISDNPASSEPEPAVMLNASHHGNELLASEFVFDAIQYLLERYASSAEVRRRVDNFEIWCVPLVNPDGRQLFVRHSMRGGRKNRSDTDGDGQRHDREGIDLNRNYPFHWGALGEVGSRTWTDHAHYRGASPASAPETRAMMKLAMAERFVASISYHTSGTTIMPPYAYEGVESPLDDEAWEVAMAMAEAAPLLPGRRRFKVKRRLYSVDGVEKDWLRFTFGTVAFVVEGPLHNPREAKRRKRAIRQTRATWIALLDRFLDGPSISGDVRDAAGAPLEAEIRVVEIKPRAGERWTSRPRDGFFARFVPRPGEYNVVASAPGYEPAQQRLMVEKHVAGVRFVLVPIEPSVNAH